LLYAIYFVILLAVDKATVML